MLEEKKSEFPEPAVVLCAGIVLVAESTPSQSIAGGLDWRLVALPRGLSNTASALQLNAWRSDADLDPPRAPGPGIW